MSDVSDELQAIYDEVPDIACKGRCWNSCGPIDMNPEERERIRARGIEIDPFTQERAALWAADYPLHCAALDMDTKRCRVYNARPLICRLWGVTESMPCPHGCKIDGEPLTDDEAFDLIGRSMGLDTDERSRMDAILQDPELGPLFRRFFAGDRSVEPDITRIMRERSLL